LNIFMRDASYNVHLCDLYPRLKLLEQVLEVPLDSYTANGLLEEDGATNFGLRRWDAIIRLTPEENNKFQQWALLVAERKSIFRVHLDLLYFPFPWYAARWGWISKLDKVPGFVEFHLLKGPEAEDHTLYASHTVWENRAVFEAWTKSEAFRAAHSRAGENKPLYLDHPQFEGFEVRQTVGRGKTAVAWRQSSEPPKCEQVSPVGAIRREPGAGLPAHVKRKD
jgi:heme-degrading monooxygenase HmoA